MRSVPCAEFLREYRNGVPGRLQKDGEKGMHEEVARGLEEADEGGVLETSGGGRFMKEEVELSGRCMGFAGNQYPASVYVRMFTIVQEGG